MVTAISGMVINLDDIFSKNILSSMTIKCRSETGMVYAWKVNDFKNFYQQSWINILSMNDQLLLLENKNDHLELP